jgi:predicted NUDIX family phosphoesterase
MANEEQVLVIPRTRFDALGAFQGLRCDITGLWPELLDPAYTSFLPRSAAENNPSFKQIIPYAVLRYEGKILRYFRGGASGEKRLVAKASIGIGGHIHKGDLVDANGMTGDVSIDTYRRAVNREIAEEIVLAGGFTERIVALLNDDSNDVGRVHLGVVHFFDLDEDGAEPGEAALRDFSFLFPQELRAQRNCLETWSQILVDAPGFLEQP